MDWFKAYDIWDLAFSLSFPQNLSLFHDSIQEGLLLKALGKRRGSLCGWIDRLRDWLPANDSRE